MKKLKLKIRTYFVTGILITLPMFITFWFVCFLFNILNGFLKIPTSFLAKYNIPYINIIIPIIGLITIFLGIICIGILTTNIMGKRLIMLGEAFLSKLPIINTIYNSTKQFSKIIFLQSKDSFSKVVLIEYPRKGLHSIGFVTSESKESIQNIFNKDLINVFIPTTPNPTSGMLVMLPKDEAIPLDMSIEESLKYIVSGGILSSPKNSN
ncbi:MAG: DUF502 domain-containing protein [bacterium]|nr:DUF502 domain-containing protein [bacterium]